MSASYRVNYPRNTRLATEEVYRRMLTESKDRQYKENYLNAITLFFAAERINDEDSSVRISGPDRMTFIRHNVEALKDIENVVSGCSDMRTVQTRCLEYCTRLKVSDRVSDIANQMTLEIWSNNWSEGYNYSALAAACLYAASHAVGEGIAPERAAACGALKGMDPLWKAYRFVYEKRHDLVKGKGASAKNLPQPPEPQEIPSERADSLAAYLDSLCLLPSPV